jgi:hypothetical protein
MLPDARVLFLGLGRPDTPVEIYDPGSDRWTNTGISMDAPGNQALLLPNGKVFIERNLSAANNQVVFSPQIFDPVTGQFQDVSEASFPYQLNYFPAMELLSDGRVLIMQGAVNKVYDPVNHTLSDVPSSDAYAFRSLRLLPDGRVFVQETEIIGIYGEIPRHSIYDPNTNSFTASTFNISGPPVLLPNGSVFVLEHTSQRVAPPGGGFVDAVTTGTYDPSSDRTFPEVDPVPPVYSALLLEDGRVFAAGHPSTLQVAGLFAKIYAPPPYVNAAPVVGAVSSSMPPADAEPIALDVRGSSFLPNSVLSLGGKKLVTLYLGEKHLVAFVPPALRSFMKSGITVNNPGPGGGSTDPVQPGFRSAPLVIDDVESGSIRTGYIVITLDAGSAPPAATLTYGIVHNAIVDSQAAILPTPLTTDTSLIVDAVPGIGRNLGIAVANSSTTATLITLTLRDEAGNAAGSGTSFTLPAYSQLARFVTEMFSSSVIGSSFRGSLEIQSQVPVSIVGLRFSGQEFSTVPTPAPNTTSSQIVFPQFAMSGGWATTLGLVNNSSSTVSGRIDIFDPAGKASAIPWNGTNQSTFNYKLAPQGSVLFAPRDSNGQSPF